MKFLVKIASVMAVALGIGLASTEASAQEIRLRFPVEYNADIAPGLANQEFIDLINKRSNGRIKAEFFPAGSLYKGLDLLQAVLRGDAEMTTLVSVYWSAISPQLSIFELPFAFPTHEAFYRAADDAQFMRRAFSEIDAKGGVVLGVLVYDYLPIGNKKRPITKPEDMKGLKLRALGRTNGRMLQLLGAEPVPINITEVAGALERGVIDGLNTPADAFISYGWEKIVPYVTDSPHYFAFYPWAVNKKWWLSLSQEHRNLIQSTVNEVAANHRKRARQQAAESFDKMAKAGVKVHKLTPSDIAAWETLTKVQWDDASKQFGPELIQTLRGFRNPR
jgi:C4-dicarboxylate-binding protein DctP